MSEPAWLTKARSYLGFHETGDNQGIQQFVDMAAQTDMVEANLGQLAQSAGSAQNVKDYGQMLATDHTADYGNLLWLAWTAGLRTRVDTWGPPPLEKMTNLFFEMNAYDINTRIADEGRVPLVPLVHVHELTQGGPVMQDENVKVTAALVHHPPVVPSFGYRFDAADRSIVISGDTAPSDNLIKLAQGADVLVHEALYVPGVDRLVARVPNAAALKQSIMSHHTTAEDAGRVAKAAGVKTLVLSHLVPADDPAIADQMWIDAARVHFQGPVVVGKDLLEL